MLLFFKVLLKLIAKFILNFSLKMIVPPAMIGEIMEFKNQPYNSLEKYDKILNSH